MKNSTIRSLSVSSLFFVVLNVNLHAQPSAFTYQGELKQNGQPANGTYDFMFRLLDAPTDGTAAPVIPVNPAVSVTNGLFTTGVDFDAENLNGANLWLEINVRTNGNGAFTTLTPRQLLTSVPYAVKAANVNSAAISGIYGSPVSFNNSANSFVGNGAGLTSLNANALTEGTVPNAALGNAWKIGGNAGTTAGTHFIGTTDDQPFEIKVNGLRVGRFEPTGDSSDVDLLPDGAPNVILGSPSNMVAPGIAGATIGGGGATNSNGVQSGNLIEADSSTIAGGHGNEIQFGAFASTISGGILGSVGEGSDFASVGGGYKNVIGSSSVGAIIAGGRENMIGTNGYACTIAGGQYNRVLSLDFPSFPNDASTIAGGSGNEVGVASGYGFIGGGNVNVVGTSTEYATLVGGRQNQISGYSHWSFIGGGYENLIDEESQNSVIVGGRWNRILGRTGAGIIGGGFENQIVGAQNSVDIGGGQVIVGGRGNRIETNSSWSAISGGRANLIYSNSEYASIPGGRENTATNFALAAGFRAKAIHVGSFVWADSTGYDLESGSPNSVTMRATGGYRLFTDNLASAGVSLAPNATAWSVISDRTVKKDITSVDSKSVLEKLAAVPVQSWRYKWESSDCTPNLGPMAQDFKTAFFPGRDDKSITTLEFDGVELAAIQGLNQKLEENLKQKETEIEKLKRQNHELLRRLEALEARIK